MFNGNLLVAIQNAADEAVISRGGNATRRETLERQVAEYKARVQKKFEGVHRRLLYPLMLGAFIPFAIIVARVIVEAHANPEAAIFFAADQVMRGLLLDSVEVFDWHFLGVLQVDATHLTIATKVSMILLRYVWETIFVFTVLLAILLVFYLLLLKFDIVAPKKIKEKLREISRLRRQERRGT